MSQLDTVFLIVGFCTFLLMAATAQSIWQQMFTSAYQTTAPSMQPTMQTVNNSVNNNFTFWNASYVGLFIVMGLVSVALTIFISSHPVFLFAWLLVNLVSLMIYDSILPFVASFATSSLNSGAMANAFTFFQSGLAKAIIVINVIMAIVMIGGKLRG